MPCCQVHGVSLHCLLLCSDCQHTVGTHRKGSTDSSECMQMSRPKLALWRSVRERGIWMRDMAASQAASSAAEAAYLAAVLSDKYELLHDPFHECLCPTIAQNMQPASPCF